MRRSGACFQVVWGRSGCAESFDPPTATYSILLYVVLRTSLETDYCSFPHQPLRPTGYFGADPGSFRPNIVIIRLLTIKSPGAPDRPNTLGTNVWPEDHDTGTFGMNVNR